MTPLRQVERSSFAAAPPDLVWERVTSAEGINDELRPWLRMTVPAAWGDRAIGDLEPPETLGRSWILAAGLIPIDYDRIRITEIGDRSFQEDSTMLTMTVWRHARSVTAEADGSRVSDRLEMLPRRPLRWIPGFGAGYAWVVARIFAHRHRRLRRWAKRAGRERSQRRFLRRRLAR